MEKNQYESAFAAGLQAALVRSVDSNEFVVVPDGCQVKDLEFLKNRPRHIRQLVKVEDEESFCNYFKTFSGQGSRIFASEKEQFFKAVMDYHTKGSASWGSHVLVYTCQKSKEWNVWLSKSGTIMKQQQFAEFIEDNLPDIREPVAAKMLEIAKSLEAKKSVKFASSVRLDNGAVEFLYEENIAGTAKKGKLEVPDHFKIGIPVFVKSKAYEVKARFRYRIADGGELSMWYDLHRPHKIEQDAFKQVLEEITKGTGSSVLMGSI
ncbi:MAG: DUF2303 family protein [Sulfuricaulis sp.]